MGKYGNGIKVSDGNGVGIGMKSLKWEGIGTKNLFPHTSSADLHMSQLMPLPLTVSCFSKIQIGFTFLVPVHLGSPGKRAVKRVCVCVC